MTKKQLIWLVIRFIGVIYLFMAIPALLMLINCFWGLIKNYPFNQASSYLISYLLFNQTASSAATLVIAVYMMFFGKFIYRVVDKSTTCDADSPLTTFRSAEIMIRFLGVYFLWGIFARMCISLYSAVMLARFKYAPADFQEIVPKNEMLSQHFKNLRMNLSGDALISLVIVAVLAFYFLKRGSLVIDLFHHYWLPKSLQPQTPDSGTEDNPQLINQ